MKICILASPRTRSTVLLAVLKTYKDLTHVTAELQTNEYFTENDNYIVKFTPSSFHHTTNLKDYTTLPWDTFDKIIFLNRENLPNQFSSWYMLTYAQIKNGRIPNIIQHVKELANNVEGIDMNYLFSTHKNHILKHINEYYKIKEYIEQNSTADKIYLSYEEFETNNIEYINKLNNLLDTQLEKHDWEPLLDGFTGINYLSFIEGNQISNVCKNIIQTDNLTYLKNEIESGRIIC